MKESIINIINFINKLAKYFMILTFTVMVIIITMQVFYRYVLVKPIPWAEEAARYLFVWATFLGASVAVKTKQHTIVLFFVEKVPEKMKRTVLFLGYVIVILFLAVILFYGTTLSFKIVNQTSPALQLSMFYPSLALPIGALVMILNFVLLFFEEYEIKQ